MMHRLAAIWCFLLRSKWCCSTAFRNDAMFSIMCRQAHIIREANIIRRSRHHLPKANIIQKTHLCLGRQKCVFCWRRVWDSNSRAREGKRFSRSLPKNTVSAQFGAFCAKTFRENPYFTRLFGTVWNRYEWKRIDRNRYRPLVFWWVFCTLERIWREFAREKLQLHYIEIFLFLERIFHDLGENFLCVTI